MDRQRMERCLERVAAYRASGQKANVWAAANGVALRELSSWCAHSRRWQARLDGVACEPAAGKATGGGFVAASLPPGATAAVRIELHAGASRIELHWPLSHSRELAAWLREVGR